MKDILFVSAQPDVLYFHWQVKIYVHNFLEKGIDPRNIHVLFSLQDEKTQPSDGAIELMKHGINIHFFVDDRDKKNYIPSIKPFLISKWIEKNEEYGKCFFLHDSDIIFRELPLFENLINDDKIYVSDTIGYLGYDYLKTCCRNYEREHKNCLEDQLINEMCEVVGIEKNVLAQNQNNSGGGQYLIKNTNYKTWVKIYNDSNKIYSKMIKFHRKFPIQNGSIQFWTAEMWSVLWNLFLIKKEVVVSKELNFSWATDKIDQYEKKPILHMAGVTEDIKKDKFYKGDFINVSPLEVLEKYPFFFDYINEENATIKYVDIMKSILKK